MPPSLDGAPTEGMAAVLKVHLNDGGLCIFNKWVLKSDSLWARYSSLRQTIDEGAIDY